MNTINKLLMLFVTLLLTGCSIGKKIPENLIVYESDDIQDYFDAVISYDLKNKLYRESYKQENYSVIESTFYHRLQIEVNDNYLYEPIEMILVPKYKMKNDFYYNDIYCKSLKLKKDIYVIECKGKKRDYHSKFEFSYKYGVISIHNRCKYGEIESKSCKFNSIGSFGLFGERFNKLQ
jgi:hypothetical protein